MMLSKYRRTYIGAAVHAGDMEVLSAGYVSGSIGRQVLCNGLPYQLLEVNRGELLVT
jgi:hypothetical protein